MKAEPQSHSTAGALAATGAFLIWGLSPVYWKLLDDIPALQITAHRIVWSALLLILLVIVSNRWGVFLATLRNRQYRRVLIATALLLNTNWLAFIWAVNSGFVRQASLGYYINPLVNVVLGMLFLHERLSRPQAASVLLAAAAVAGLTLLGGKFPAISLLLAGSFGSYGLLRKKAPIDPTVGLAIETLVLLIPALAYLGYCMANGTADPARIDATVIASGVITTTPLLLFILGTKRLRLSTVGLMQYIAPTCMFLLALFRYKEPFARADAIAFVVIWTALAIYSADSLRQRRNLMRRYSQAASNALPEPPAI